MGERLHRKTARKMISETRLAHTDQVPGARMTSIFSGCKRQYRIGYAPRIGKILFRVTE